MDSGVYPRFRFIIDKPFELDGQEIVVTVASDNWSITFGFITHGSLVYEYTSGRQYEDAEYVYVDSIEFTNTDDYTATIDSNWGEPVYKS